MVRGFGIVLLLLGATIGSFGAAQAAPPADSAFQRTWERTDQPVAAGQANRTWMWGQEAFTPGLNETYAESPGGQRLVQYYDKSRMEISNPQADSNSIWYVTNGLLVVELTSGRLQLGNNTFEQRAVSTENVAGDADDATAPTYATFATLLDESDFSVGTFVTARVSRDGTVTHDWLFDIEFPVLVEYYDPVTSHAIAEPFWDFMNSSGTVWEQGSYGQAPLFPDPFFATGRPITEAYWAEVKVANTYRDVLIQCFERRCLTYTPGNPEGWQVEAGNVGQHYYDWRYENGSPPPLPPSNPPPPPTDPGSDFDGLPAEGEVLYDTPMTQWKSVSDVLGNQGRVSEGEYQISLQPRNALYSFASSGLGDFYDASYSVEVRRPSAFGESGACLVARAVPLPDYPILDERSYNLCLYFDDQSVIGYEAFYGEDVGAGSHRFETLLTGEFTGGDPAAWHKLKIVAKGQQFWFFIDDLYLGMVPYAGGSTVGGQFGVAGYNFDEAFNVTLSYQKLVVRSID